MLLPFVQSSQRYNLDMIDDSYSQRIEIYLACRQLIDLDVFSKSDPYIRVSYRRESLNQGLTLLGRTQTIPNNLNPNYVKSFQLDYIFEAKQDIRFELFDDDGNGAVDSDDYIGFVETTVGKLMGSRGQMTILDLINPHKQNKISGKLVVRCEKIKESSQYLSMKFRAGELINTDSFFDFWDKSDPYLKLIKMRDDGTCLEVHRTEIIKDSLQPVWQSLQIQASRLINPNKQCFKIEIWDWQEGDKDQFIGQTIVSVAKLQSSAKFELTNPKQKKPGVLLLQSFQIINRPSFVDYLRGGLQLNMAVAIDFTASNGSPKFANSLHFMNNQSMNQYQTAIYSLAQILLNYDFDKKIPALGFGAKTLFPNNKSTTVNHCFPLSGNMQQLQAVGLEHLMNLYHGALQHIELSGPTFFAPIISEAMKQAEIAKSKQYQSLTYQVLLILTDGQIHDMEQTIQLIIRSVSLPLSIIIVGVGNADFDSMNQLDGDSGLFGGNGMKAGRDIVQFVAFRDIGLDGSRLAKELLAELPKQVVQYMQLAGIVPAKPQVPQV